jgi:HSP20 family protein
MREELKNNIEDQNGILTLDVFQKDNDIVIKSAIAGVSGKDLDISITSDTVSIKGIRKEEESEKRKNYFYQELNWGSFSRTVILPEEVDADKAKATLKNGVLIIVLPKLK